MKTFHEKKLESSFRFYFPKELRDLLELQAGSKIKMELGSFYGLSDKTVVLTFDNGEGEHIKEELIESQLFLLAYGLNNDLDCLKGKHKRQKIQGVSVCFKCSEKMYAIAIAKKIFSNKAKINLNLLPILKLDEYCKKLFIKDLVSFNKNFVFNIAIEEFGLTEPKAEEMLKRFRKTFNKIPKKDFFYLL